MAVTEDALYLGGVGLSRLSLTDAAATPQPVAGFEGREITALAADAARGRLYVGDVAPQLGDVVEVVNVETGDHEPYERGFATVTTLGVDADGAVLVADDPSLATQFTAWQARLWAIPVHETGWPQATITSSPAAASAATDVRFAYRSRDGASFECRLDGGAFEPCPGTGSGEQTYHGLPEGEHHFSVRAKDGLTGLHAGATFTLDRTAPKVTAIQPANEYLEGVSAPRIRFSVNEPGIAYTCSLDGGPFKPCYSGNPVEGLAPGVHVLRVVGTDAAGNASDPNAPSASVRITMLARWRPDRRARARRGTRRRRRRPRPPPSRAPAPPPSPSRCCSRSRCASRTRRGRPGSCGSAWTRRTAPRSCASPSRTGAGAAC